jgi:4-cresol dehydrogenase (hydroxylating)
VTFRAFRERLRDAGSRLHAPVTGSSPDASIIGTALECGIGKFPYGALSAGIAEMEIVLANGSIIRSGMSAFYGAQAAGLEMHGPGPSLTGLFHQSNFGVVTEAVLTLEPSRDHRQRIALLFTDDEGLAAVVDALRDVLQRNRGRVQLEFANAYRVLTQTQTFPWHEHDGFSALPRDVARKKLRLPLDVWWAGAVTIAADDEDELRMMRDRFRAAVAEIAGVECGETEAFPVEAMSHDGLRSAYWRKREPMPRDPHPDRDGCGVFWISAALPMRGSAVLDTVSELEEITIAGGFEPSISARTWDGRTLRVVLGIFYDRAVPHMDDRAAACHEALLRASYRRGAIPYRLGLAGMALPPPRCDDGEALLRRLKDLFDPNHILAPGRYVR